MNIQESLEILAAKSLFYPNQVRRLTTELGGMVLKSFNPLNWGKVTIALLEKPEQLARDSGYHFGVAKQEIIETARMRNMEVFAKEGPLAWLKSITESGPKNLRDTMRADQEFRAHKRGMSAIEHARAETAHAMGRLDARQIARSNRDVFRGVHGAEERQIVRSGWDGAR